MAIFTANTDLAKSIRRPLFKQYNLMNGPIATKLLVFNEADERSLQPRGTRIHGPVEAFANRLRENVKQLSKWAKRENVCCYRMFDAEIHEYARAIVLYDDWLHVQV